MSQPAATPGPRLSTRAKLAIFAAVCAVALTGTAVSVIRARHPSTTAAAAVATMPLAANRTLTRQGLTGEPWLLFRSTALDRQFGTLSVAPLADPTGPRTLTPLKCDRVDFNGGRGVCFSSPASGLFAATTAKVFDDRFNVLRTITLTGYPSRVRVSPDGAYAAVTAFVSGDSYATIGFSTRTSIIDLKTGSVVLGLEQLTVRRDGAGFQGVDFNFWGVTFANDSHRFYATLGTGGRTYLIQGDVGSRQATVVRSDVECPSLSPDNTRIAFKQRLPGAVVKWRLSVLDLSTMKSHAVAETRNVDDQAEWLDNTTLLYGLPNHPSDVTSLTSPTPGPPVLGGPASIATSTWAVPADGTGSPEQLSPGTWSTVVVRP